ncbi:hypothetical protein SARC_01973 [Sphaeroforma arctica JP610]|uniref:THAP-type domain-containing protein n=1 Tax=Sphaeroforma arctica JP610 TaxID=667725 RepID=A0A0L0GAD1_9EUKA|nr:hypothetical protein SARC_01973 [Sphaeroforma arctica JP610]KNC85864.1 hypothetical protein SARC_01973 [Sphaeroforma arctica JP610]|eukprot:XP_014159766.1 hypothetical protein SARC_01973 [Sphaeroforma arctica JP610]
MCGAVWCKATAKKDNPAVHVPKKLELRREWLELIRPNYSEHDLTRELRVCHKHFKPEQFHQVNKYTKLLKGELPMTFEEECTYYDISDEEVRQRVATGRKRNRRREEEGEVSIGTGRGILALAASAAELETGSGATEGMVRGVLEEKNNRITSLLTEVGVHAETNTKLRIENERLRQAVKQVKTSIRQVIKESLPPPPQPVPPPVPPPVLRQPANNMLPSAVSPPHAAQNMATHHVEGAEGMDVAGDNGGAMDTDELNDGVHHAQQEQQQQLQIQNQEQQAQVQQQQVHEQEQAQQQQAQQQQAQVQYEVPHINQHDPMEVHQVNNTTAAVAAVVAAAQMAAEQQQQQQVHQPQAQQQPQQQPQQHGMLATPPVVDVSVAVQPADGSAMSQ